VCVPTLTNKALALGRLGNFTGAILYYDKALAIQPNDTYALDNKAAALVEQELSRRINLLNDDC
jgi:tetratricopeptide (TPR) repeat protein